LGTPIWLLRLTAAILTLTLGNADALEGETKSALKPSRVYHRVKPFCASYHIPSLIHLFYGNLIVK